MTLSDPGRTGTAAFALRQQLEKAGHRTQQDLRVASSRFVPPKFCADHRRRSRFEVSTRIRPAPPVPAQYRIWLLLLEARNLRIRLLPHQFLSPSRWNAWSASPRLCASRLLIEALPSARASSARLQPPACASPGPAYDRSLPHLRLKWSPLSNPKLRSSHKTIVVLCQKPAKGFRVLETGLTPAGWTQNRTRNGMG